MSGIYIPNAKIPKRCQECQFLEGDDMDGLCHAADRWLDDERFTWYVYEEDDIDTSKPANCPLVAVPDHGRLIDADALIDDLKRQCKEVFRIDAVLPEDFWINRNEAYRQRLYESWCEGFYEYVGSRPTIIPADKEGE